MRKVRVWETGGGVALLGVALVCLWRGVKGAGQEEMCYCHCNVTGALRPEDGYPRPGWVTEGAEGRGGAGGAEGSGETAGPGEGRPGEAGQGAGEGREGGSGDEGQPVDQEEGEKEVEELRPPIWSPELEPGLGKADLSGTWKANPFTLTEWQPASCMADIVFVLDGSGSVTPNNWSKMLQFVQDFAARLPFGLSQNRIGVISYANEATLNVNLNSFGSLAAFQRAVATIAYMETSTHTAGALRLLRTAAFTTLTGDRLNVPNIAIVMTDGESMISPENTVPEAKLARQAGIIIFTVGIGFIRNEELKGIANKPASQFVYEVKDFDTLINRVDDIVHAACEVSTCSKNDIAFVLDSSGSIGSTNWEKVKEFVGEFANNLAVGADANQVGVVTYSTMAELNVRLDEFWSQAPLSAAIHGLPWKNHRTNTSGGIRLARQAIFNRIYGDRPDAPNIAIVMTDGFSNIDARLTALEADTTRQHSVRIFAIGVGDLVEMSEISAIASNPGYHYEFLLRTFDDLVLFTRRIFDVICSPLEPSARLDFSRCKADLGFVLDGSVEQEDWQRVIAFLKDLAQRLPISPDANQVGIVTYGQAATLDVKLNQFRDTSTFEAAADDLASKDKGSNTAEGLELMREQLFHPDNAQVEPAQEAFPTIDPSQIEDILGHILSAEAAAEPVNDHQGDRPDVPNIAIVITDSESTASPQHLLREAEATRAAGITVFAIGVGSNINLEELRGLAWNPVENHVFQAANFDELLTTSEHVLGSACHMAGKEVWVCRFEEEEGMCGIIQEQDDQFDWTRHSGPTPSDYTGPPAAFSGLHYIFIEASNPQQEGDEARFILPLASSLAGTYCLRFHAYMFGFHVGALQVFIRRGGTDVTRWTTYGPKGAKWNDLSVDLRLQPEDQVGIRATRGSGYSGDIGIDDLRMTEGSCPH